jgi:hypothetical protein
LPERVARYADGAIERIAGRPGEPPAARAVRWNAILEALELACYGVAWLAYAGAVLGGYFAPEALALLVIAAWLTAGGAFVHVLRWAAGPDRPPIREWSIASATSRP